MFYKYRSCQRRSGSPECMRDILLCWTLRDQLGKNRSICFGKKILRAKTGCMRCSVWCLSCKSHMEARKDHKVLFRRLSSSCLGRSPCIQFQASRTQQRILCIVCWLLYIQGSLSDTRYRLGWRGKSVKDKSQGMFRHSKAGRVMLGLLCICGTLMAGQAGMSYRGNCSLRRLTSPS